MNTPRIRRHLGVLALAASAVLLAGCSSATADPSGQPSADGEPATITVGASPSINSLALHVGIEEGIFAEHDLNVEIVPINSMGEGIPLLLQGSAQAIYGDVQNGILAVKEGLPVMIGAPTTFAPEKLADDGVGFGNLLALSTSDIQTAADAAGKTIGTNTIGGQAYMEYLSFLESEGVDVDTINWVEVPGPQLLQSLRQGTVDLVTVAEPNGTSALLQGDVKVVASADLTFAGAAAFGWYASREYMAANADVMSRFQDAMIEANTLTNDDREIAEKTLAGYTELTPEVISAVRLPLFAERPFTDADLESTLERIVRFDVLAEDELPDLAGFLPTP